MTEFYGKHIVVYNIILYYTVLHCIGIIIRTMAKFILSSCSQRVSVDAHVFILYIGTSKKDKIETCNILYCYWPRQ